METQHPHQNKIQKLIECKSQPPLPPPPSTTASPPSSSSSPAHEFSFTISLHQHHQPPSSTAAKPQLPSTAMDLSPADEIFFHGHLLPLHFLSHLPPSSSSARSSTKSLDRFTLPINKNQQIPTTMNPDPIHENPQLNEKPKPKSKSFSLFGIPIRRKADYYIDERETEEKQRKKQKFDLSQVLKRYMRMVRPLFNKRRESDVQFRRQPYSFSGYLSPRDYYDEEEEAKGGRRRRRRRECSAPASMKTSPSNSGLLVGDGVVSTSESTMEELQAAIQAAIAHCKNSIAMEEKINKC